MKREFGKKLIESFFPSVDLTHVIDTSGAYIPGHGTPTVILIGRHRPPVASTLRAVMGIRGEPSTPADPARGLVWSAIVEQLDQPDSQSEYVSVGDSARELFHKHPWSVGGGGVAELKELLEASFPQRLIDVVQPPIGRSVRIGEEDAFVFSRSRQRNSGCATFEFRDYLVGESIRDWLGTCSESVWYPYATERPSPGMLRQLWAWRTSLASRRTFQGVMADAGLHWFQYMQHTPSAYRTPNSITFAFVATHNHFALDRGGRVFQQSAPAIKLREEASEDEFVGLLGVLNSSVSAFFMKQVAHNMGDSTDQSGARTTGDAAFNTYQFNGTQVGGIPIPATCPLGLARTLDALATCACDFQPASIASRGAPTRAALATAQSAAQFARSQMIAAQEELDWECYRLYGLIAAPTERPGASRRSPADEEPAASAWRLTTMQPPPLKLGQRAFEIVLARKMAAGETQTTWFERHGSTPITELPAEWTADYRQLVERRIALIASDPNIRLIEQPEYKRRWNTEPWDTQLERALREWLLDRLESYFDFDRRMREPQGASRGSSAIDVQPAASAVPLTPLADIALVSVAKLADVARQDTEFLQVGELYRDDPAFDVQKLVTELVAAECVPLLPVLRYKDSGLRKRAEWERTWELQREEDRISNSRSQISDLKSEISDSKSEISNQKSPIPVPPKYDSKDFLPGDYWRLRGKLDVPKERWSSFPHCDGPDNTLVIAWAGYDHLQQAKAISAYYVDIQERLGGRDDPRLIPLLAGMLELLPWLKQWHNEPNANFDGLRMGDYFEGFVNDEAKQLGKTVPEIKAWEPPQRTRNRVRR